MPPYTRMMNSNLQFVLRHNKTRKDTKKATQTQTTCCWLGLDICQLSHGRKIHGEKCESKIMHKLKNIER